MALDAGLSYYCALGPLMVEVVTIARASIVDSSGRVIVLLRNIELVFRFTNCVLSKHEVTQRSQVCE